MIVCLDANCIIYLVEQHPTWGPKVSARLADFRKNGDRLAFSDLCRTECLALPFARGNAAAVASFQTFFHDPSVQPLSLTESVCERAARIRASTGFALKLPDCLHLAAAIEHGCGLFLTNDAQLARCTAIAVEVLS